MAPIPLTIATGPYDTTRALFDGSVGIDGAAVTTQTSQNLAEIFERVLRQQEFDVAELGWTFYLRDFSPDSTAYRALPVFPNRHHHPDRNRAQHMGADAPRLKDHQPPK